MSERAQASIEVVALVPVLVLVIACVWQAALAGLALTAAESASRAARGRRWWAGRRAGRRWRRSRPRCGRSHGDRVAAAAWS